MGLSSSSIVKKIILVTASTIIDDEIQCHQFGLRDFIRKPFNIKLSRVIIEKHLLAILDANYTLEIHGPFSVNLEKREMSLEDEVLDLSFGQFTIFYTLLKSHGKVIEREELLDKLGVFERNSSLDGDLD